MLFFSRSKIPRCLAPLSIEPPPSSPLKKWQHFAGAWARTTPASWGFDSPPPRTHNRWLCAGRRPSIPRRGECGSPNSSSFWAQLVRRSDPGGRAIHSGHHNLAYPPPRKSSLAWKRKKSGMENFPRFRLCVIPYGPFLSSEYMTSAPIFSGEKNVFIFVTLCLVDLWLFFCCGVLCGVA